jgi:hypothetical protein
MRIIVTLLLHLIFISRIKCDEDNCSPEDFATISQTMSMEDPKFSVDSETGKLTATLMFNNQDERPFFADTIAIDDGKGYWFHIDKPFEMIGDRSF